MARPLQKLSKRHKLFARYYVESFNATQSALKVGCKESNAYDTGWKWLQDPLIKDYIAELFRKVELSDEELKGIVSSIARDDSDKSSCIRANELMAKIKGIVKQGGDQQVNVMVDASKRADDILSRRFGGQPKADVECAD